MLAPKTISGFISIIQNLIKPDLLIRTLGKSKSGWLWSGPLPIIEKLFLAAENKFRFEEKRKQMRRKWQSCHTPVDGSSVSISPPNNDCAHYEQWSFIDQRSMRTSGLCVNLTCITEVMPNNYTCVGIKYAHSLLFAESKKKILLSLKPIDKATPHHMAKAVVQSHYILFIRAWHSC